MPERDWAEILKTLVLYLAVPIAAILIIYKIISDWLMGPVKAVEDLWKQQYDDFVAEAKQFAEEDGGALTEEHLSILDQKRQLIAQTEKTYVQLAGRYDPLIYLAFAAGLTIVGFYVAPAIIKKWKGLVQSGDVQSEMGASYIALCMIADDLAYRGYTSEAAALATTITTRFENVDKPYMESQIAYWQNQLPTLVGWELLYAQYIISAYQTTITMVPIWLSYLPPMLRGTSIEARA